MISVFPASLSIWYLIPNGILLCAGLAPSHTENVYAVSEREIVLGGKETRGSRKRIDWNEKTELGVGIAKIIRWRVLSNCKIIIIIIRYFRIIDGFDSALYSRSVFSAISLLLNFLKKYFVLFISMMQNQTAFLMINFKILQRKSKKAIHGKQ